MKLSNYFRKKIMFFVITIFLVLVSVAVSSYALSVNNVNQYKDKTEHINVEYLSGNKNLEVSTYPMFNDVGFIYAPKNEIKIINTSDLPVNYEIILTPSKNNELKNLNKIMVSINGSEGVNLKSLKNGVIKTNFIDGLTEDIFDIRIWTDKNLISQDDLGKNIGLNLSIQEK